MSTPLLASIIIPTKNGERYLRSMLDSIVSQTIIDQVEVIVIDSGSIDSTLQIVANYPNIRLYEIPPEEFGHGKTRNYGARLARGQYLVYIPQDATPEDTNWLETLLKPFSNPSIAGVFGRQKPRQDASAMESFFLLDTYHLEPEIRTLFQDEDASFKRCFFSTVSGAIRASLWKNHPFREDIIMSEDQAWAKEVMLAGLSIAYEPNACVQHSHQYGIADIFRRNFDSGYSIHQIYGNVTGVPFGYILGSWVKEAVFVLRSGKFFDLLRFFPYESARHLGFLLGLRAEKLPLSLRRSCSNLRYFWGESIPGNQK